MGGRGTIIARSFAGTGLSKKEFVDIVDAGYVKKSDLQGASIPGVSRQQMAVLKSLIRNSSELNSLIASKSLTSVQKSYLIAVGSAIKALPKSSSSVKEVYIPVRSGDLANSLSNKVGSKLRLKTFLVGSTSSKAVSSRAGSVIVIRGGGRDLSKVSNSSFDTVYNIRSEFRVERVSGNKIYLNYA